MVTYKIANVLLEDEPRMMLVPTLYCRATSPFSPSEDQDAWELKGGGSFDFTTFFNALSVAKWQRYTVARTFTLHLEVRGGAFDYVQTRADEFSWYSEPVEGTRRSMPASDGWSSYDIELEVGEGDVLCGFVLEPEADVLIRGSYYATEVDEALVRPVELALCTTTFKKEEYVRRNVEAVRTRILGSAEPIASHFRMHVVDNGRTLDPAEVGSSGIEVHPNPNAGGAGGFTRGMIEAMAQEPRATHVLLMDDDVSISPESIIRTFNLLSLATDEYSEAFVSGAMMNMDEPEIRWEDMGFVAARGAFYSLKTIDRMGVLHDAVMNETFVVPSDDPSAGERSQHYAAWWYCVIPVSAIERAGLPLPVFVRCDDVEYSLRCRPRFMTMNGICVWHMSFRMRYSAAVERYQMTRNVFVAQATTGMAPLSDFTSELHHNVMLELKKFNYQDASLALDGFEDFLKGPSFISQPGVAERTFMEANRKAEKLWPIDELRRKAAEEGIDLSQVSQLEWHEEGGRSRLARVQDFVSFNGQRVDLGYTQPGKVALIKAAGWENPAGDIRRCDTIVAIDLPNRKGIIRHMDRERFREVWDRYKRDVKFYRENRARLEREYADARAELTSVDYWRSYLGLDAQGEASGAAHGQDA